MATKSAKGLFSRYTLWRWYWALERRIAPGLRYSQYAYEESLNALITPRTRWLDIGCGHHVLPEWRLAAERELVARAAKVVGVDPDKNAIGHHRTIAHIEVGTAENLPLPNDSFDLVTANMVMEHVADPSAAMREIRRVLAPHGLFLFLTPNMGPARKAVFSLVPDAVKKVAAEVLEGRKGEDVYPTYYLCNRESDVRKTALASGMEVDFVRHVVTSAGFAAVLPLAFVELLWIRATMRESMKQHRAHILAAVRKPDVAS